MECTLPRQRQKPCDKARIQISKQKRYLEENKAGGPDSGRSSEPRNSFLCDQRLDEKKEERAKKYRARKDKWDNIRARSKGTDQELASLLPDGRVNVGSRHLHMFHDWCPFGGIAALKNC